MKMLKALFHWVPEASESARRFPFTIIATTAAFLMAMIAVWAPHTGTTPIARYIAVCATAISLTVAIALFRHQKLDQARITLVQATGLILLGAFTWLHRSTQDSIFFQKLGLIALGLHFLVAVSPFVFDRNEMKFWEFNRALFARAALTVCYSGLLFGGILAALGSLQPLFGISVNEHVIETIGIFIAFPVSTLFFLAGVPSRAIKWEQPAEYPKALRLLITNVTAPLIAVYFLILYVYSAKILITRTWPDGAIGWLVSALATLVILTHLLSFPIQSDPTRVFFRWLSKNLFRLLLPLLILLFIAIHERVDAYGWTQARVLLFALACWSTAVAIAWSTKTPRLSIFWIPTSLAAIVFVMAVGPFSAFAIALRSQTSRFEKLVAAKPLDFKDIEATRARYDRDARFELSRTLDYICQHGGKKAVYDIMDFPYVPSEGDTNN